MAGGLVAGQRPPDETLEVKLGGYRLTVASSFGPRVLGLRLGDGPEMLAGLPDDVVVDRPDSGIYRFRGGHRLWASPERPWITYSPDDEPSDVVVAEDRIEITGTVDRAGLSKHIVLTLVGDAITVDHTIVNAGSANLEVAPWAITQLPLGGTALIPVLGESGSDPLQADRSVVIWPYTDLSDHRISWRRDRIVITASEGPVFKIGTGPAPGRIGYLRGGYLFIKTITPSDGNSFPDRGAVAQFFMNEHFSELESVGAVTDLAPGFGVAHREIWQVAECADPETADALIGDGL